MKIVLNGKDVELDGVTTVLDMLKARDLVPETVVVELNKEIVPSDRFAETEINDGDHLEVLRFVGGG